MEYHRGRLFDHVQLRVRDLEAGKRLYRAVLGALDPPVPIVEGNGWFYADELFVDVADGPTTRVHLAFQANSRAVVERSHQVALAAGGTDNGAPGERPYHAGYFAAFVLDPDGNNVEAVFHGPARRTAESVVIMPAGE